MGSSTSKAAKTAAGAARRQYPQRVPPPPTINAPRTPSAPAGQPAAPGPTVHPQSQASESRDESISLDASDPDFARSLRSLGPVQPNSTLSDTSTFSPNPPNVGGSKSSPNQPHPQFFPDPSQNPALLVLKARERLQQEAEVEFARTSRSEGGKRGFLDISTIRQILVMRDEKRMSEVEIEKSLGLGAGVVKRLGAKGVVGEVGLGKVTAEDAGLYG
ncbi:hypothetical protein ACLMJK_005969 [Lecanora helva]